MNKQTDDIEEKTYTAKQLAEHFQLNVITIYRYINRGLFGELARMGGRSYRIGASAVRDFESKYIIRKETRPRAYVQKRKRGQKR